MGFRRENRVQSLLSHMEHNTASLKSAVQGTQRSISQLLQQDSSADQAAELCQLREEVARLRAQASSDPGSRASEQAAQQQLEELAAEFARYRAATEEKLRRQLGELFELKGQIRVICRVKPFAAAEAVVLTPRSVELPRRALSFPFAKVLPPGTSQAETFAEIEDLVFSVTQGYRVSILAYGPTGSGKTYTVQGTPTSPGLVQQSLAALARELDRLASHGWRHSQQLNLTELYNDQLLSPTGLEEWTPVELDEVEGQFNRAAQARRTGSTQCNQRSSRSHLILRLQLTLMRVDPATQTSATVSGSLCLADLAGSERLAHSQAAGLRLKEAVEINKSLSALGDVVQALANHAPHIPYRNSKLTWALRDSLGAGAKSAVIISIDPGLSVDETVTALRFAQRLQQCPLGRHQVNQRLGANE